MLLLPRIEDRLQEVHEAVWPADILRPTAPSPVHEGRILDIRITVVNLLDDHVMAPVVAVVVDIDEPLRAARDHEPNRSPFALYITGSSSNSRNDGLP